MKTAMKSLILVLALALMMTAAASAQNFYPRQIDYCNEFVTLRAKPSAASNSLAQVYFGEVVMASDYNSEFSYCCYNGKYGYIKKQYLNPDVHTFSEGTFRIANCNSYVSLRTMPITSADVRATIPLGATLDEIYYADGGYDPNAFAYVKYHGQYGWVLWRYLEYVSYGDAQ